MSLERADFRITGLVQGVHFRETVRGAAHELGLAGWIRNRPDGSVDGAIEGPKHAIDELLALCEKGPPAARVQEVVVDWRAPEGMHPPFVIRR
ncbi:MAG: acylphosphatase [Myxococcales bacterium]|nr:acylphosphatase [Myxococcales bacterium]MCB9734713.1 acylphosphatase [Deltaproteobacteria bacterium]